MPNDDYLEEQRRHQRDLIELKKLKQAGESLPNTIVHDTLDTPKAKWNHFWHYYGLRVLAAVIAVFFVAFMVAQCVNKPKYDYTILLNSDEFVIDPDDDVIEKTFQKLGEDINGDGEVTVLVVNCSRDENGRDVPYVTAQRTKFETQVYEAEARIIMISDDLFDVYNTDRVMLWSDHFALPEKEGKALNIADTSLGEVMSKYEKTYYIGYRVSDRFDDADAALFEAFLQSEGIKK